MNQTFADHVWQGERMNQAFADHVWQGERMNQAFADKELAMNFVSASLKGQSYDMGRIIASTMLARKPKYLDAHVLQVHILTCRYST